MSCSPFLVQPPPPASLPIWLWKSSSSMRHSTLMLDSLLAERIFLPQNKCYKWMDRTSWRFLGKWLETGHVMNPTIFHLFICNHVINANYPKNLITVLYKWKLSWAFSMISSLAAKQSCTSSPHLLIWRQPSYWSGGRIPPVVKGPQKWSGLPFRYSKKT